MPRLEPALLKVVTARTCWASTACRSSAHSYLKPLQRFSNDLPIPALMPSASWPASAGGLRWTTKTERTCSSTSAGTGEGSDCDRASESRSWYTDCGQREPMPLVKVG